MCQRLQRSVLSVLLSLVLVAPLTASAWGQARSADRMATADKQAVLDSLTGIIEKDAFVPNVDFKE